VSALSSSPCSPPAELAPLTPRKSAKIVFRRANKVPFLRYAALLPVGREKAEMASLRYKTHAPH